MKHNFEDGNCSQCGKPRGTRGGCTAAVAVPARHQPLAESEEIRMWLNRYHVTFKAGAFEKIMPFEDLVVFMDNQWNDRMLYSLYQAGRLESQGSYVVTVNQQPENSRFVANPRADHERQVRA